MSISVGAVGTASTVVTPENTAAAVGSGSLPVFATPYMIALMENAACNAIADALEDGQSSVGTKLDVSHDAATPVGMHITAKAELVEVDRRRLVFRVTASDDAGPIGQGSARAIPHHGREVSRQGGGEKGLSPALSAGKLPIVRRLRKIHRIHFPFAAKSVIMYITIRDDPECKPERSGVL